MKYMKIQTEIMKLAEKHIVNRKNFMCPYFEDDKLFYLCPDGKYIIGIPHYLFFLDKNKIWEGAEPFKGNEFLKESENASPVTDTHTTITQDGLNLHKFTRDDVNIYVNEKYLNYFEPDARFTGTGSKNPLFVYEGDILVGAILPVYVKEGEQ